MRILLRSRRSTKHVFPVVRPYPIGGERIQNCRRLLNTKPQNTEDDGLFFEAQNVGKKAAESETQGSLIYQYGALSSHADLDLSKLLKKSFLTKDTINGIQSGLLKAALSSLMPPEPVSNAVSNNWCHPGWQQVYFRPRLTPAHLLADGTDTRFLPGPASIWAYRLWAGGSVTLCASKPSTESSHLKAFQHEYVEDVRIVGKDRPERVFVKVVKDIGYETADLRSPGSIEELQSMVQRKWHPALQERYTLCFLRSPPGVSEVVAAATAAAENTAAALAAGIATAGGGEEERRKPSKIKSSTNRSSIKPPSEATFQHQMTANSNLLFQFSALTHNAHAIHLDPSFARDEYKLKAPVVHGPLTMVLMMEFVRLSVSRVHSQVQAQTQVRAQASSSKENQTKLETNSKSVICKHFDYKNFAPLYVDEEFTLCCKPVRKPGSPGGSANATPGAKDKEGGDEEKEDNPMLIADEWQVWIQTGRGDDVSLAAKGTVKVALV